tara:strand:- start:608 stop:1207 length:600 start_codon:yes stop_codon:yes gene_type:complete
MEASNSQPFSKDNDLTELQRIRQALFGEDLCRINLRLKKMEEQLETSINGFSEYIGHLERKLTTRLEELERSMETEFQTRDEQVRGLQVSIAGMQKLYGTSLEQVKIDLVDTQTELRGEIKGAETALAKQIQETSDSFQLVVEGQHTKFTQGQEDLGELLVTLGAKFKTVPTADPEEPIFKKTNGHNASDNDFANYVNN